MIVTVTFPPTHPFVVTGDSRAHSITGTVTPPTTVSLIPFTMVPFGSGLGLVRTTFCVVCPCAVTVNCGEIPWL